MSNEKIYIYHTNDIHSDLTYWPRLASELKEKRAMHEEKGEMVLAFDTGDATDRVNPLTEATDGQAITKLLNEGNYDAVTIGNNEGITNSKEELSHLYDEADFSVILTNLFDLETGTRPHWAKPYEIFKTKWGDKIGVFGLTAPLYETYEKLGWQVSNPVKQTQDFFKQHIEKADFWILLSHLGIDEDRYLAKLFPLPLIIGAHTHHVLINGEFVAGHRRLRRPAIPGSGPGARCAPRRGVPTRGHRLRSLRRSAAPPARRCRRLRDRTLDAPCGRRRARLGLDPAVLPPREVEDPRRGHLMAGRRWDALELPGLRVRSRGRRAAHAGPPSASSSPPAPRTASAPSTGSPDQSRSARPC